MAVMAVIYLVGMKLPLSGEEEIVTMVTILPPLPLTEANTKMGNVPRDKDTGIINGKQVKSSLSLPLFVTNCQTNKPIRPTSHVREQSYEYAVDHNLLKYKSEGDEPRAASFEKIYEDHEWGGGETINGTQFGGSGPGSLMSSTEEVRKTLDAVIDRVKSELGKDRITLLDLPCGDLVWMKHYLQDRHDIDYTGMDIVGTLIESHTKKHAWKFKQHDIVKDPLDEKYDLIFSRQMTQHLGTEDTMRVLQHFSDGGRYLLISNYPHVRRNTQLNVKQAYRFRQQNFNLGPYNLIDPLCEDEEMGGCVNNLYNLPLRQWEH